MIYEDLGTHPATYHQDVAQAILNQLRRQLRREQAEARADAYYANLRHEAAQRRAQNPGAYTLPPGHQPIQPPTWHNTCPHCGHELTD